MSWIGKMALLGGVAEAVMATIGFVGAGVMGLVATLVGSGIASSAQITAVALLRPGMKARTPEFVRRWASGMAIRAGSVLVLVAVVFATRTVLPALWTALGFLGVLLTLLYAETRFLE